MLSRLVDLRNIVPLQLFKVLVEHTDAADVLWCVSK